MPGAFLYTRPSDRVGGALSVAVGDGVEDDDYPAVNLDGNKPDFPAKLTTTSGAWTRDVGFAQRIDLCALIHHNLSPGLEVRLQGHTTPLWADPRVNVPFTIPPPYLDNFRANVWLDLTSIFDRTLQFWRLAVVGANAAPVALGEWAMYTTKRTFGIRNISRGSERAWKRPALVQETDFLVRRVYPMATVLRSCRVSLESTDAVLADVDAWQRSALGQALPFVVVPHSEQDDAWFVTFTEADQTSTRAYPNVNPVTLDLRELSRGLHL